MGTPAYPTTYRVNVRIVGPGALPIGLAAQSLGLCGPVQAVADEL